MGKVQGKVAIVTGGAKGIGSAVAKALAAEGAAVLVNYSSSKEAAEATVAAIVSAGGRAVAAQGDVSKAQDAERLFALAEENFGPVMVLVNNAAIGAFAPFEDTTEADYHRIFTSNVLGTIQMIQAALKHFPKAGGSIVNIGTISSQNPVPMTSVYSASKAAVDTLTLALAKELGSRNIRINVVAPGYTATDQTKGFEDADFGRALLQAVPLRQELARPEDIAPSVVFLASDEAAWLTGERISASGGAH
ncbi:MAG: short-chain dehydrogenase [Devosia sp.]|uniref:SDR family NAD(P)-dependent oxidoreductase n=1 Tax=Devosia sp. TaxID=1871048 RepID=UPI002636AA61|nr:SDR family oxidoreductase [Devosia sp.]MDB5587179.1 short-chain dehydrogenase [Devosia sp.]